MDRLYIRPTDSTLEIDFDPQKARLLMRGESYPENAAKFFAPVTKWLQEYFTELDMAAEVTVDMDIVYFNSSSSKVLMNMFEIFDNAAKLGIEISMIWRYDVDNEIAEECGEEFGEELQYARFTMFAYGESS